MEFVNTKIFKEHLSCKFPFKVFKFIKKHSLIFVLTLFIFVSLFVSDKLGVVSYIKSQFSINTIYEDYYVVPSSDKISFPKEKKNLILIYVESLENTYSSLKYGGAMEEDLIPELTKIASNNVSFSNNNLLGGALPMVGTSWTVAGMVSSSSGVQLHTLADYNSTEQVSNFLPNLITLGDILDNEGYSQYLMLGSDARFGNRYNYYTNHGNYNIFDYYSAIEEKYIEPDYYVWWGYEDKKLFEYSKYKLLEISKGEEPFNFTLLTADTHFVGGYLDPSCSLKYDDQFRNVLLCSSGMIGDFVSWIQEQDFYKDTSIVIIGDHLTMDNGWISANVSSAYQRTVYNAFINPFAEVHSVKDRTFTQYDFFPTILASMGVKIEGDRLGLGTNLFSEESTLTEELGYESLMQELFKRSRYYDDNFVYADNNDD